MKLEVPKGKYVLAVSGGVDSMALLHLMAQKRQSTVNSQQSTVSPDDSRLTTNDSMSLQLIVAHFNHGIRPEAALDEQLVKKTAVRLGLPFRAGHGQLGQNASEEQARIARYDYLNTVKNEYMADKIITAHHQDDLIETAFINLIRGTHRLGLSAITSNQGALRPLLGVTKAEITRYAKNNKLVWREDASNRDTYYLRNHLRLKVIPKLAAADKKYLISNLEKVAKLNTAIDKEIATLTHTTDKSELSRAGFSSLPAAIANEVLAASLRQLGIADFDSKTVNRLSLVIKTAKPNSSHHIKRNARLVVGVSSAEFVTP